MSQAAVGPDGSSSPARRSCMFYKLMAASILQDKKLKIPKKFVNKYGDELSSIATLTVPCGRIWLVELQNVNGRLWFHKGWHEFVECYSIRVGYFLVFIYEGKSNFNVHMFDLSVSEIKNPCNTLSSLQESIHDNPCLLPHEKDDGLEKILGCRSPCPNLLSSITSKDFTEYIHGNWIQSTYTAASLENPHLRTDASNLREKSQTSRDIGTQFNGREFSITEDGVGSLISGIAGKNRRSKRMIETNVDKHESLGIQNVKLKSARVKITSETLSRRWRAVTPEEKERTILAALKFRSDNPFFRVILRPSYVYRAFLLHIPCIFARTFMNRVTGFVTLQVSDGKQWPVRCCYKDGVCRTLRISILALWMELGLWLKTRIGGLSICNIVYLGDYSYVDVMKPHKQHGSTSFVKFIMPLKLIEPSDGKQCSVKREKEIPNDDSLVVMESTRPSPSHNLLNARIFFKHSAEPLKRERDDASSHQNLNGSSVGVTLGFNKQTITVASVKKQAFGCMTRSNDHMMEGHEESSDLDNVKTLKQRRLNKQTNCDVHELPAEMYIPKNGRPAATLQMKGAIYAARRFEPEKPAFLFILGSIRRHVYVPAEFSRKYWGQISGHVTLRVSDGREWSIKCFENAGNPS
ncbi:unnamed protein product [Dovyalis caffra]|uniref:TF-B3 domain-containing protein n=1 Tax=Dovyalis caffra TaxID=77055 RepID=A0AAV1RBA0_9ROSI|nr:unnamed protein product [Dovyalis caffra]